MTSLPSPQDQKLVRVQEKGQVTLPTSVRRKLGIKKGDLVAVVETDEGVLITPREIIATQLLDRIGAVLKEKGLTVEELLESGREERGKIVQQAYGLPKKRKRQ